MKPCYKSDGTKEIGAKIIAKLESLGCINGRGYLGDSLNNPYYYIDKNGIISNFEGIPDGYTLCSLEKTFPREMWVWDEDEKKKYKLIVEAFVPSLEYPYLVIKTSNGRYDGFKHAKEIEEPKTPKQQAIDKLNELSKLINEIL